MFKLNEIWCRVCAIVSGLLLGLPNIVGVLAPVQCFALLPILLCVMKFKFSRGVLMASGMYMALAYALPQMAVLLLPVPIVLILIVGYTVIMIVLVLAADRLLRNPTVIKCFVFAALVVVLDWANFTALPMWGTAQSIVRPWSSYPHLIAFISVTGMGGIIFLLALLQAAAACMINARRLEKNMRWAVSITLGIFVVVNGVSLMDRPVSTMKVAAIGWNKAAVEEVGVPERASGFEVLFAGPVRNAAAQGVKLAVSPEMGFYVDQYDSDEWTENITALARVNNIHLIVGYVDAPQNKNRMLYIDNTGKILAKYTKTYLTPFESFVKGQGQPKIIVIDGIKTGGMICQDDNFTSISRRYGRKSTGIVAVPTLDWKPVRFAHYQNSIHRAIESRYAIVRASFEGISAIISPMGKIITSYDNVTDGAGMIIADVDVYDQCTVYSLLGNWFVLAAGIFTAGYIIKSKWLTKVQNAV